MPERLKAAAMTVIRMTWMDDNGHALAIFGNPDAAKYLFEQLTDEQAAEFVRLMADNSFDRTRWCMFCEAELNCGNNICPKCGRDNEDK